MQKRMTMNEVITEIQVVSFPPGEKDRVEKARDLDHARRICHHRAADNPLIQQRTITVTPWILVENHAKPWPA